MPVADDLLSRFYPALLAGNLPAIAALFAAQPLIEDARLGLIEGNAELKEFVREAGDWLRWQKAAIEDVATTADERRVVEELVLHLEGDEGPTALPVAVVGDVAGAGFTALRIYHSLWPLLGAHTLRMPVLPGAPGLRVPGVTGEYQRALAAGDVDGVLACFEPDGYVREPAGDGYTYRGAEALREFYGAILAGGGIPLEHCTMTHDATRTVLEYNVLQWGDVALPPQAGAAVYERGPSGRLAAARIYDDVERPVA